MNTRRTVTCKTVIGVDPGAKGGIACISQEKILLLERTPCKKDYDLKEMVRLIKKLKKYNPVAYIEEVHSMPKQGVRSMFTFGRGFGIWIGILAAFEIPIVFVEPRKWKKKMIKEDVKDKEASIKTAKELFPGVDLKPGRLVKDNDGLAEALLISAYGGLEEWN